MKSEDLIVGKIAEARARLLSREKKMLGIISEGPISYFDLVGRMFTNEMIRFFPGTGITESHVQKLLGEGRIRRNGGKVSMS